MSSASYILQDYRARARNAGYADVDNYSDEEIIKFLGDDLRQKGLTRSQIESSYGGDFSNAYYNIVNAPEPGREGILGGAKEFGAGFKRGASGLMSSGSAIAGMAFDFLEMEEPANTMMDKAAKWRAAAAEGGPSISRATDVNWGDIDEVARFLAVDLVKRYHLS